MTDIDVICPPDLPMMRKLFSQSSVSYGASAAVHAAMLLALGLHSSWLLRDEGAETDVIRPIQLVISGREVATASTTPTAFAIAAPNETLVTEPETDVLVMPERAMVDRQEFFPVFGRAVRTELSDIVAVAKLPPPVAEPAESVGGAPAAPETAERIPRRQQAVAMAALPQAASEPEPIGLEGRDDLPIPRLIRNPPPRYPDRAAAQRLQGTTWLDVDVTARGEVGGVRVASSSGHPILDAAAVRAVRSTWRYEPARVGGRPKAMTVRVYVRFRL